METLQQWIYPFDSNDWTKKSINSFLWTFSTILRQYDLMKFSSLKDKIPDEIVSCLKDGSSHISAPGANIEKKRIWKFCVKITWCRWKWTSLLYPSILVSHFLKPQDRQEFLSKFPMWLIAGCLTRLLSYVRLICILNTRISFFRDGQPHFLSLLRVYTWSASQRTFCTSRQNSDAKSYHINKLDSVLSHAIFQPREK